MVGPWPHSLFLPALSPTRCKPKKGRTRRSRKKASKKAGDHEEGWAYVVKIITRAYPLKNAPFIVERLCTDDDGAFDPDILLERVCGGQDAEVIRAVDLDGNVDVFWAQDAYDILDHDTQGPPDLQKSRRLVAWVDAMYDRGDWNRFYKKLPLRSAYLRRTCERLLRYKFSPFKLQLYSARTPAVACVLREKLKDDDEERWRKTPDGVCPSYLHMAYFVVSRSAYQEMALSTSEQKDPNTF